ncbi:MAG: alpha/beta fold hydrolase [Sulfurifustaceae bacterium]
MSSTVINVTMGNPMYCARAGAGPRVLCLHSTASSSRQYRDLMDRLASRFCVIAPDFYGHGQSPAWDAARRFTLADEAAPIDALLADNSPAYLVGHSYGAAVALRVAAANRTRIRAMVLYEPAIWGTLAHLCPDEAATREIETVRDETICLIDADRIDAAAERFIDYWSGAGSWSAIPADRRPKLLATMGALRHGWIATFSDRWTAEALRALDIPCLLLTGTASTRAARRALRLLGDTLPRSNVIELDGLGHLGPITHPERVINPIETFLQQMSEPAFASDSIRRSERLSSHCHPNPSPVR